MLKSLAHSGEVTSRNKLGHSGQQALGHDDTFVRVCLDVSHAEPTSWKLDQHRTSPETSVFFDAVGMGRDRLFGRHVVATQPPPFFG